MAGLPSALARKRPKAVARLIVLVAGLRAAPRSGLDASIAPSPGLNVQVVPHGVASAAKVARPASFRQAKTLAVTKRQGAV